jgi:hypothetical protein
MSNVDPTHDAQLMMMVRRTPWYAAIGGFLGALIALLLAWLICGWPCDHHDRDHGTSQPNQAAFNAPLATTKSVIRFI